MQSWERFRQLTRLEIPAGQAKSSFDLHRGDRSGWLTRLPPNDHLGTVSF